MNALLLFPSIHYVLRAERLLQKSGVAGSLIPVPHDVSTECGMAWSMPEAEVGMALVALGGAGLPPDTAWVRREAGWERLKLDRA